MMFEAAGFTAATLTSLAFLPQVHKAWQTRSAEDLSMGTLVAQGAGVGLWIIYGVGIGSLPVIASNTITLALMLALIALKRRYGN
jgi:MtN3 and saliva related transmembrane protein